VKTLLTGISVFFLLSCVLWLPLLRRQSVAWMPITTAQWMHPKHRMPA